jgi:ArsR family transcriptional regulator
MTALVPPTTRDAVARHFRLLGEPARLELLNVLHEHGEMTVGDLVDETDQRQANVSKHLGLMADEDLLARRRDGVYVYYSIQDPTLVALCQLVRGRLNGALSSPERTDPSPPPS